MNFFWGQFLVHFSVLSLYTNLVTSKQIQRRNKTQKIKLLITCDEIFNVMQGFCVAKLFFPRPGAINDSCIPAATWGWSQNLGLQASTFFWLFEWSRNNPITYINLNLMSALLLAVEWRFLFRHSATRIHNVTIELGPACLWSLKL